MRQILSSGILAGVLFIGGCRSQDAEQQANTEPLKAEAQQAPSGVPNSSIGELPSARKGAAGQQEQVHAEHSEVRRNGSSSSEERSTPARRAEQASTAPTKAESSKALARSKAAESSSRPKNSTDEDPHVGHDMNNMSH